ncbi:MAG TPA: FAD-binding oxidoreductase [Trebonia sp.]|nr:FAD-binding oxidoreductase [Trebonia sp.]
MPIPPELAAVCGDVALAGGADTIAGRQARFVAAPASTEEASALLRAAAALGLTVVPRGAGRLQHWGNPPDSCDLIVDTRRLDRIMGHAPDDLTVTVQAGVRLRDLARAVEAAGQSLALLPPRPAHAGTVGGLIATNAAGPRRYRFGTPRDRLAGITAVRADGTIVRSADAARIAGQDLVTLFAGSYGSLGLITEATFRLEPLCKVFGGSWLPCTGPEHAAQLVEAAADPSLAPSGIDLRWPAADEPLGLIVMLEGDRQDFEERRARLLALAGRSVTPLPDPARALRLDAPDHGGLAPAVAQEMLARRDRMNTELLDPPADTGTLVRVSFPSVQLAAALIVIRAAAAGCGVAAAIGGSAGAGVLDVKVPAESPAAAVARFVAALRAELGGLSQAGTAAGAVRAVVVYAPDEVRDLTDTHGPVPSLALIRAVKDEFDPEHRMAPGRMADAV